MKMKEAWAIRPYPHGKYRMRDFLTKGIAAIGWPDLPNLTGMNREEIRILLRDHYDDYSVNAYRLGQATGSVSRFVNEIRVGHAIVVPDSENVFFGVVTENYSFKSDYASEEIGYPHWIGVRYVFDRRPILRSELPAILFDALKGRQTVFSVPPEAAWEVVNNPERFSPVDTGDESVKIDYIEALSFGKVPGINSPRFENAVLTVLSLYFPGLQRLATTNAPPGADTDLHTSLPGDVVIRVQVKCYQDAKGPLGPDAVSQLRKSMEDGEHGILVTTSQASRSARDVAASDMKKPVGIIDGPDFAQLVFDNLDHLDDKVLWALGLRRMLASR